MIHINEELCVYCGACVAVCPENIIDLVDTHLKIDQPKCTDCMKCVKGCPIGVLSMERNGKIYAFDYADRGLF